MTSIRLCASALLGFNRNMSDLPHIPVLRFGEPYTSLDTVEVTDYRTGDPLVSVSQVNAGIIRRDARRAGAGRAALSHKSCAQLIDICADAAERFMAADLPLGENITQSPRQYIEQLCATSGLPHALIRRNMEKIRYVLAEMATILRGLTRGLDLSAIDEGFGEQGGAAVSYFATTNALGTVLPSNSPGVNSIWMPAVALKMPVMIKPGREEPWTPLRIIQSLIAAGCPPQAFGFYPTDHEGADALLTSTDRGIIFGDDRTLKKYADNPHIEKHGTGRSKIILGDDQADRWKDYLDLMVDSVVANGGRSCINCSCIITPRNGRALAEGLAKRLSKIKPTPPDDDAAQLAAFANVAVADYMNDAVEEHLQTPGAHDMTALFRDQPRRVEHAGSTFLQPTVVYCESFDHPLANTEYLFPFVSVVEVPQDQILQKIGPSLVVSVISDDAKFQQACLGCVDIDRLNLGPVPTMSIQWDQPHEGNLFEFLYRRRAIQRVPV